jgi:WD40 repeat protein
MNRKTALWTTAMFAAAVALAVGCAWAAEDKARPSQGDATKLYDTYKDHTGAVLALAINPLSPNEFVSGGCDKTPDRDRSLLRVWDFAAGKQAYTINNLIGDPFLLSYSSDGRYLLVGQDNYWDKEQGCLRYVARLTLYDARRGRLIKNMDRGQFVEPYGCAFAPDSKSFTIAGAGRNFEIWNMDPDPDKIAHKRMLTGHQSHVPSTCWAPDSTRLASASMDGTVKLWDISKAGDPLLRTLTGHDHSVNAVAWSTDGLLIASGSSDKTVKIWDANTGVCKKTLSGHSEAVTCVAITPDSRIVISASMDRTVKIWDPATGTCLQTLTGHDGPIEAIAVSSDGRVLLTGSQDKTIKSWVIGRYPKAGR